MAKKIIVNGGFIVLSDEVINELHRQERIEEGQRIAKKFVSKRVYNKMVDADFEKVTLRDFVLKLKIKRSAFTLRSQSVEKVQQSWAFSCI